MAVTIGSNISSLDAQRRLSESTSELTSIYSKLSSGLRITKASDDAAGLQIASGLKVDATVYSQGIRNINDGASLLNVTQGAVEQLANIVTRQAELSEQSANGIYTSSQRSAMNNEANALVKEYNRIIDTTSFNGIQTLNGLNSALRIQFGYGATGGITAQVGTQIGVAAGDGTFQAMNTFATGGSPFSMSSGDFNGDGITDLVSGDSSSNTVSVLLGNGNGTFKARISFVSGSTPYSVSVGDFNGDGISDIVSADHGGNTVSVLLGNGDGTFKAKQSFATGSIPYWVTHGDFNGDGISDIVAADSSSGTVSILLGNGDGTFKAKTSFTTGSSPLWVGRADFNGDGIVDLVTADHGSNTASVLLGNGDGTFKARQSFATGNGPNLLAIGDVNGDGIADIASADTSSNTISILLGNGNGTFQARQSFATGSTPGVVSEGDFNGDGVVDLISADAAANTLSVYFGNGDGSFKARTSYATGNGPGVTVVGDFNGDGVSDLVFTNNNASSLGIFLGNADPTRRNNHISTLNLTTQSGAKTALTTVKAQLAKITLELGNIGALQSRLAQANATLQISRENYDAAYSQLMDADIADTSSQLASTQIRQQAATAVLAQANQQPQLALRLLGAG